MLSFKHVFALATLFVLGCSETPPANSPSLSGTKRPPASSLRGDEVSLAGPPPLPSVVVAELADPDRAIYFARNGGRGLIVAKSQGKFVSGPVRIDQGDEAVPGEAPTMVVVAEAPEGDGLAAIQPHGEGFLFTWSAPDGIHAIAIHADGKPDGEALEIGAPKGALQWVDIVGDFILWQEGSPKSRIYVRRWPDGEAILAADGAHGWHATATPDGIAVAWVDGEPGKVRALTVGKSKGKIHELADGALADVQIASVGGGEVVAWTDVSKGEPHIRYAVYRGDDVIRPAAIAAPPVGGQALVGLVASADRERALIAWEQELAGAMPRRIRLGLLEGELAPAPPLATLAFHGDEGAPHVVSDGPGFALLTLAPMITEGSTEDEDRTVGPIFIRLSADLSVRNAEPIRVTPFAATGGIPTSVHGLSCSDDRCTALAKGEPKPPVIVLATLPVRNGPWRHPITRSGGETAPQARAIDAIAEVGARIADLDAVRLHDGRTMVAWVTHTAGEPGAAEATLAFRFVDGETLGPVHTLSERAIALGGVRIAALPPPKGPRDPIAILGWAGPNNDTAQVYLSAIAADGDKLQQKTLTQHRRPRKNEPGAQIFDVDVAAIDDGVTVVWADTRDGNPELYAARADIRLARRGQESRLTRSDGPSLEPRITTTSSGALLAWTDAEAAKADLWVAPFDAEKLTLSGAEKITSGTGHVRTPQWAGQALSFIEEGEASAALKLVAVDAAARPTSAIRDVRLGDARPTSATVRCDAERCRGLVIAKRDTLLVLGAFEAPREHGAPIVANELGELSGGTLQDLALTAPSATLDSAYFYRDDPAGLLRRISLAWP